jgi:hypothetical protein
VRTYPSAAAFAKKLGHTNGSFVSQLISRTPGRPISEKSARKFEALAGIAEGELDKPVESFKVTFKPAVSGRAKVQRSLDERNATRAVQTSPVTVKAAVPNEEVLSVVRQLTQLMDSEGVTLNQVKFPELLALMFLDQSEHGTFRTDYAKQLLSLVSR